MNKFFIKKVFALLLAFTLMFNLFACKTDEVTEFKSDAVLYKEGMSYATATKRDVKAYASLFYEFLGGETVMPIAGFYGPHASGGSLDGNERTDLLTDDIFAKLQDAGINMIVYGKDLWHDESNGILNKMLDLCDKYGIGYYVMLEFIELQLGGKTTPFDPEKMPIQTQAGQDKLQKLLDDVTKNGTRKSVIGIHAKDEPFPHEIKTMKVLQDVFDNKLENNYGLDLFGNALGYWANEWNIFGYSDPVAHDAYMVNYMNNVKPKMLSATQYPFTEENTPEKNLTTLLYDMLAIYRDYGIEYNVPFWRMLQAGGQWNDAANWIKSVPPYQSESELLLDVNMSLAYGAKAIQYFPLVQPFHFAYQEGGTYDYERNGLIGANGNLTRWYYYAQRANNQIKAIDEYLMKSYSEGVIVHGKNATDLIINKGVKSDTYILDGKFRELTEILGDDSVIGCFDYNGSTAFYVVNNSRTTKSQNLLKFDNNYKYKVIQRAQAVDVVGTSIPLTLDAGEGALIVIE